MRKLKNGPESEWMDTVLRKGTISDQLAAHTLLIHEKRDWSSLQKLIDMIHPGKCRRRCLMAMVTLKDLFIDSLNVAKKNSRITDEEDKRKVRFYYVKFVDNLNRVAFDNIEELRHKAIWVLSELLYKYEDNKDYIIDKLVNKLGDQVPKLASTAGHFVEKAVNSDKNEIRMRTIRYVKIFLARPNQTQRARFYAASLLSRIKLIKGLHEMSNELMQIYLSLYATLMNEDKIDSRMMSAILTGIHRAYPYSKLNDEIFEQHLQTLYTIAHKVNFRMRVVAISLIKNIVQKRATLNKCPIDDRFYNLVFNQLIAPELHTTSRQESFIALVLNVINEDTVIERKEAFVKRILLVALNSQPSLAHLLLSTITKIKGYNTDLCVDSKDDQVGDGGSSDGEGLDSDDSSSKDGEATISSWVHKKPKFHRSCDLLARNPRAAKPDHLNELHLLRLYYDPKIADLARQLMRS